MIGCIVRGMLYPAPSVPVPEKVPDGLQEVRLNFEEDTHAIAWMKVTDDVQRPIVLFFHGNGENLATVHAGQLFDVFANMGADMIALDYPGYGRSGGTPSQASLTRSAELMLKWLVKKYPKKRRVIIGWSLGAAVAIQLAALHPDDYDALVVMSPWSTLTDVAATFYPRWMVKLLLSDKYDSLAAAKKVTAPAMVIHGRHDPIIPFAQGEQLAKAFAKPATFVPVENTGHNDLLSPALTWQSIKNHLKL